MSNYNKIISIHGAPRSGTTWIGQIIDSSPNIRYKYQPLFSDSFKDRLNVRSSVDEIRNFFDELYSFKDEYLDREKEKRNGIHERFLMKNDNPEFLLMKHVRYHYLIPYLLSKIDNIKFIGIVRNPCSVLNSWRKSPAEFRDIDGDFMREWRFAAKRTEFKPEEYFGFHKWKELSKLFLTMQELYSDKFYLLQYENIVNNTVDEIKKIFDFIGLDFHAQTESFILKSKSIHNNNVYSTFKGNKIVDDWKSELDPKIIKEIYTELDNTEFKRLLV